MPARPPKPGTSAADTHPHLLADWHPDNTGTLADYTPGSGYRARWTCATPHTALGRTAPCGYTWHALINARANTGQGCKACAGRGGVTWWNTLPATHPHIAADYDPTNPTPVDQITPGLSTRVRWKCAHTNPDGTVCATTWESPVFRRTLEHKSPCPTCTRDAHAAKVQARNFATEHPDLLDTWHPDNPGSPTDYAPKSNKPLRWQCTNQITFNGQPRPCGHTWTASPATRGRSGCAACAGKAAADWNNLAVLRPDLAATWHPDNTLSPDQVTVGSKKIARWLCPTCGHDWTSTVDNRNRDRGCPGCSGNTATATNNLTVTHPDLLGDWHPDNTVRPETVTAGSMIEALWVCSRPIPYGPHEGDRCGHTWTAQVKNRTWGTGCPAHEGLAVSWWNTLDAATPHLLADYSPTNPLRPDQVVTGSKQPIIWTCTTTITSPDGTPAVCGHTWTAIAQSRTGTMKTGCPACAGQAATWWNNLAALRPDLLPFWHPANTLRPDQVTVLSNRRVLWQCPNTWTDRTGTLHACGHTWETHIKNVSNGTGCAACVLANSSRDEIHLAYELDAHIPVQFGRHRVPGHTKNWAVDIHLTDHKIIIEYDGAYWHRHTTERDQRKTRDLQAAGWTVLRVREHPLPDLNPGDLHARSGQYKDTALTVLRALEQHLDRDLGSQQYADTPGLINGPAATARLDALRSAQLGRAVQRAEAEQTLIPPQAGPDEQASPEAAA